MEESRYDVKQNIVIILSVLLILLSVAFLVDVTAKTNAFNNNIETEKECSCASK